MYARLVRIFFLYEDDKFEECLQMQVKSEAKKAFARPVSTDIK